MEDERDEALATALLRAIQALEKMLATLDRAARTAARLRETAVAYRLDALARDVEQSLESLRSRAAERWNASSHRNGR
jgi:hypothetical protein